MSSSPPRVALISGATRGIGYEIARGLGHAGFVVLLGARDMDSGIAAAAKLRGDGLDANPIQLDLTRSSSIQDAAKRIEATFGKLDALINNAAIAALGDGSPTQADMAAIRRIMDTNFFGAVEVTRAMLPLLRRSPAGRIVNVSSDLGSLALNADRYSVSAQFQRLGYASSKAALNMLTIQLANELRDTAILVNSVNPGFAATDLHGLPGNVSATEASREPVRLAMLPDGGPNGRFFEDEAPLAW
ncbi:NAD(P)-dependent dehydrogenase (short-subunit alcohol dehydrogenase family) [Lysobacter niabensis]|uniref:NAD(P)-dependent dehydrogenase (Short-subunit alcohol dehydrogenase family) n=1 Tax=Agrilutibacter niabensis TaxID=380628 RepID=A0ABU1VR22_9GAMM|nr:SDR family NAD(P)-dependent oxidoreductase [Lysobacter niabensis]MDR7099795.1 NAD(P)-dependent dehydrogenase (short-subunit alcohol dehydrogenase family) [Lysobacter niabensis]